MFSKIYDYVSPKAAESVHAPLRKLFLFCSASNITVSVIAVSVVMNVNSVYVFLRDSYLRWESIFEATVVDQGEMGVQVAGGKEGGREGGRVGTGVNIAPGLSLGPLAFRPHRKTSLLMRLNGELMNNEDYAVLFTNFTHYIHSCF